MECREKTLQAEIEDLTNLGVEKSVVERLMRKYWKQVEENRSYIKDLREETLQVVNNSSKGIAERDTLIKVLISKIQEIEKE